MRYLLFGLVVLLASTAHGQSQPNVAVQREAMKKLDFLAGQWSGDASPQTGGNDTAAPAVRRS
jgi:hypothetical protein